MSYLKEEFGNNLRILRKARNLTQEQLAEMLDLNQRQLTRIENGISFVSSDVLEKLVIALDIDIQQLFDFDLKTIILEKSGTDDNPHYKIIKNNNVFHIQRFNVQGKKLKFEEDIIDDAPDKYLLNVAKKLNKPITAKHFENGNIEKIYIYNPDGTIKLIHNNANDKSQNIDKILTKIKKLANNENKINYINLAIDSLTDKKALLELKSLIKGIELTFDENLL